MTDFETRQLDNGDFEVGEENLFREDGIHDVSAIVEERDARYGSFANVATTSRWFKKTLKDALDKNPMFAQLDRTTQDVILEGYGMVLHKLARAVNGDLLYHDNPLDMEGYSQLVRKHIGKQYVEDHLHGKT